MSYTFLPYPEQQGIRREYRLRALIILIFFLSVAVIIGVCSLFPAYIYATFEERLHLDQVAAFKKSVDATAITATQQQLSASANLENVLADYVQPSPFYTTVAAIVAAKGTAKITSIVLEHQSATTMNIVLSGIAPTRAELLAFKGRLVGIGHKVSVDFPFSTLARDVDVPFSIQINETL